MQFYKFQEPNQNPPNNYGQVSSCKYFAISRNNKLSIVAQCTEMLIYYSSIIITIK